jgi:hypothetical protein
MGKVAPKNARAASPPATGAARDVARTLAGLLVGVATGLLAKAGLDVGPEIQGSLVAVVTIGVSALLAFIGKKVRNAGVGSFV